MNILYTIYSDNLSEATWFQSLSPAFGDAEIMCIGDRGSHGNVVDELIAYDRPDIILLDEDRPLLVLEKTREVPTGHNIGQRMARLVRAAEMGVPVIKFFPFDAMKHGTYAGVCNLNVRVLLAFDRMAEIHDVPVLAVNWPCDEDSELMVDGSENRELIKLIASLVEINFQGHSEMTVTHQSSMMNEYDTRVKVRPAYEIPPPSLKIVATETFLDGFDGPLPTEVRQDLMAREESAVYKIDMTPEKCRRQDPYTGMQFVYDYIYCRSGPDPGDKHINLVLQFPKISAEEWAEKNPDDPSSKSCNWYLTASAHAFCDEIRLVR